jgi:hypothetical protein
MTTASILSGFPESGSADKRHIGFRTDLLSDIGGKAGEALELPCA